MTANGRYMAHQKRGTGRNFRNSLEPYYRQFAKHKYFVSVFESGDRELLSDTTLLLRHNLELQMKAEPATEQVQA